MWKFRVDNQAVRVYSIIKAHVQGGSSPHLTWREGSATGAGACYPFLRIFSVVVFPFLPSLANLVSKVPSEFNTPTS